MNVPEVEFITMGAASKQLNVPAPTLRLWTDQLEEYDVHYVMRNDKNERLYYDADLEIFKYLRDLKNEHGRKTTTKDLAFMIHKQAKDEGRFDIRTREEVPNIEPTNTHLDLLSQKDVKALLESDRVRQLMGYIKEGIAEELKEEITKELQETNNAILESHKKMEQELMEQNKALQDQIAKFDEKWEKHLDERDQKLTQSLRESMDQKKGFFARLLGL